MLRWLTEPRRTIATALELYGSSVAQTRRPEFYRDWCVADSLDGRFELVMLHVGLLLRRLTRDGEAGKELGRRLVERMFAALDDDLREIGVGDLTVPKRMTAAASSFYGRLKAYDGALEAGDQAALALALTRNLPAAAGHVLNAARLAAYSFAQADHLSTQPFAHLHQGKVGFLEPGAITS